MRITTIIIFMTAFIALSAFVGQYKQISTNVAFATATARTDTTSTYSLEYADKAELTTYAVGTDSVNIIVRVDGYYGGFWKEIVADTLVYGDATANAKVIGTAIRGYGTNHAAGFELIRCRNTIAPFAVADSTSATTYNQYLTLKE